MIRQSRRLQFIILLTLVCLVGTMTIAYAILSTTLNINGTAQVMDASWNVHFENIQVNPYSVSINPTITDNDKITFSADLTTPGQFYKFTVDIVNSGSIDAMIESVIKNPELTDEQKKYLRYEVEYLDGTSIDETQLLKAGETKTISVLVSYRNDIPTSNLPTTETNLDLEIRVVYVQATSVGIEVPTGDKLVKFVNGNINTIGSEIAIGDEHFYLVKIENSRAILLTKYNLYVGSECSYDGATCVVYGDDATGIQNSSMLGWRSTTDTRTGVLYFAPAGYWDSSVDFYPSYVYNSNSTLYEYVEFYKSYLQNLGVVIDFARLIKKEELIELGCSIENNRCGASYDWVYSTSYWTGTAETNEGVWYVNKSSWFGYNLKSLEVNYGQFGVRPVIEISLSYF